MNAPPLLELRGISRSFIVARTALGRPRNRIHAVQDVSLSIPAGTTFGLVGESGSGKSTLGRLALRLVPVERGEIIFEGRPVTGLRGKAWRDLRRRTSMVFQDPRSSLDPTWTVGRSIAEPVTSAAGHRRSGSATLVAEALTEVGLSAGMADRYPAAFSGGQRQRISIARALITKPRLIVCDEPVSGLDVSSRAQIMTLLRDLQEAHGLTYLFISHDLSVIRALSQNVGVMYLGSLVEAGSTHAVATRPAHPYTQAILNSVPDLNRAVTNGRSEHRGLSGDPPSPLHPPTGCAFHPRCPLAMPRCEQRKPTPVDLGGGHTVACHLHGSEPA